VERNEGEILDVLQQNCHPEKKSEMKANLLFVKFWGMV